MLNFRRTPEVIRVSRTNGSFENVYEMRECAGHSRSSRYGQARESHKVNT